MAVTIAGIPMPADLEASLSKKPEVFLKWQESVTALATVACEAWNVTLKSFATGGASSAVFFAVRHEGRLTEREVLLKIPLDPWDSQAEVRGLESWYPITPQVFEYEVETGIFLMDRIRPGTLQRKEVIGEDTIVEAALLAEEIHTMGFRETPAWVKPLSVELTRRLEMSGKSRKHFEAEVRKGETPVYRDFLGPARYMLSYLLATHGSPVVCHGDFLPKNILRGVKGMWQVIDPIPVLAEREYDLALWATVQDSPTSIQGTLDLLAATYEGLDRDRLGLWAYLFSCLEQRIHRPEQNQRMIAYLDATPELLGRAASWFFAQRA